VPGDGLVMSSRTRVVVTGSNVRVASCPGAVAQETSRLLAGMKPCPSQYDTVIVAGRLSAPPVTNVAVIVPIRCAVDQVSATRSFASDEPTAGRFAVVGLWY
jgi:hypothetical protein